MLAPANDSSRADRASGPSGPPSSQFSSSAVWRSKTHLPPSNPDLGVGPLLGDDTLLLLERTTDGARRYRDVAVVAVTEISSVRIFRKSGTHCGPQELGGAGTTVREAGGFPRECHCDGCRVDDGGVGFVVVRDVVEVLAG